MARSTTTDTVRTVLLDAAGALLDEVAGDPKRRAALCETFVDNLLGVLQLSGTLAMKDRARRAETTH